MRIGRTILACWMAMSLAMLPLAGAFVARGDEPTVSDVVALPAQEHCHHESIASEVVVASAHDCCDHESIPTNHMMKGCDGSANCIAKCFTFAALKFAGVTIPSPTGGTESHFVSNPFHSQTASPPYRPPRV